jgi:hypothetical protein
MKKPNTAAWLALLLIIGFLAVAAGCSNRNFTVKTVEPKEGDQGFGVFEKQKFYRSRRGEILRIDSIFTADHAAAQGFASQIDFYEKGQPSMIEVKTTPENAAYSGLSIRREYLGEGGGITKIEIMLTDESKWLFTGNVMETFRMFPPLKLKNFNPEEAVVADIPGMAHLKNLKTTAPLTAEESALLKIWSENRDAADTAGDFNASVLVEEEGKQYRLLFNEGKLASVTGKEDFLVFYNYIGNSGGQPVFLMIGIYNLQ